jgi:ADP-heptose:LPS heptosyltransferase
MINIDDFFIHQHYDYAIGNFIMTTPTIKALSDYFKKPINVYFDTKVSEKMFEKCDFINILTQEEAKKKTILFSSSLVNQEIPDWEFIYKAVLTKLEIPLGTIPHTYVDSYDKPEEIPFDKYCLVIRGANHIRDAAWKSKKDVGHEIYNKIIKDTDLPIVFIGDQTDYDLYIQHMKDSVENPVIILNDIKKSLGAIKHAEYIIANDTGVNVERYTIC